MIVKNFIPFPYLTTEHLNLRRIISKDLNELFILKSDERLLKSYYAKSKNYEETQQFLHKLNDGIIKNEWIIWGIALKNDNKLIGSICILNIFEEQFKAEIGYELMYDSQGKGIMQEAIKTVIEYAFKIMKLRLIEAFTKSSNFSSVKLLERNNFIRGRNFTETGSYDGKLLHWVVYSLQTKSL